MKRHPDHATTTRFYRRVRDILRQKGWSQHRLAKECGESRQRLNRYLKRRADDRVQPQLGVARRIADALGVTLDQLTRPE